ncbi:MAG: DUF3473 domain-containing protein [Gammaproteobacteria bacterium]
MSLPGGLTVTLDLEDHTQGSDPSRRWLDNAARLLELLAGKGVRATVFIVGDVVAEAAALVRRAAADGHELALHSATHTPLTQEEPRAYARALAAARARLADTCGQAVQGYRAPVFSLTPRTAWVVDVLGTCGFSWSSSVLPAVGHPLHGYPGAPMTPFRWPGGLVELPVPVTRLGPLTLPFLGGIYLRYLPLRLVEARARRLPAGSLAWTYLHPYDIDAAEPYFRFPGTSAPMSLLLWRRRRHTLARLDWIGGRLGLGAPLGERIAALGTLPGFAPGAPQAAGQSVQAPREQGPETVGDGQRQM